MMGLHGLLGDLRQALRQFGAAPAWSATVVAVLALGIGLALATFMLVDALLFRPLGIVDQDRLVRIATSREYLDSASFPAFLEYRDRADVFDGVAAASGGRALHWRQPDGSRVRLAPKLVSGNFFEVAGVRPALGRALVPDDDVAGAPLVAVISHALWQSRFGGRTDVLGTRMTLDDREATIVGVAPASFSGLETGGGPSLYLPLATGTTTPAMLEKWSWHWLRVYARMKPGITLARADAQVDAIARARDPKKIDGDMEKRARATAVFPLVFSSGEASAGRAAWTLVGGALLILLTACANATGLLLVRGERRRAELAMRAALGAGVMRLARGLFAESAVLALAGAALGVLFAHALIDAALAYGAAQDVLLADSTTMPQWPRATGAALALALVVAAVSGVLPALRPRRLAVAEELKSGGGGGAGRRWRAGRVLVGAQFALTVVLTIGAGLLLRSLWGLWATPVGVASDALVMRLDYPSATLDTRERVDAATRDFLQALEGRPGVAAAGVGAMVPVSGSSMTTTVRLPERTDGGSDEPEAYYNPVSSGYFEAVGIRLRAGRGFGSKDVKGAPGVAIVSETLARKRFPNVDPIGRHVDLTRNGVGEVLEIVGVAPDVKFNEVGEPWRETLYVPLEQRAFGGLLEAVVRPRPGSESASRAALAAAWQAVEPNRAVPQTATVGERVAEQIATPRFLASTLGAFAVLALLLAATGIYGAFAFWVSVRRRELGLRLAVGASTAQVFTLVLGDGLRVIAAGAAAGVIVALALARLVASALVGVSAYDAPTYILVPLVVALAGMLAATIPARNAARIDPQQSLRCE